MNKRRISLGGYRPNVFSKRNIMKRIWLEILRCAVCSFFCSGVLTIQADLLSIRREDNTQESKALRMKIENTDVIYSGVPTQHIREYEGVAPSRFGQIKGIWFETKFEVHNVIKGQISGGEITVQSFLSGKESPVFFYPLPEEGRCIIFLNKSLNNPSTYIMAPSTEPVLTLPDKPVNLANLSGVEARLKGEMIHAVENGDVMVVSPSLDIVLRLTDQSEWHALLQSFSSKVRSGSKGIILAYRLSLGDITAADEIDALIQSGKASQEELDVISISLIDQKDSRLKPFLLKWISCASKTLSTSAYETLVSFEDKSIVPVLISALDHNDSFIRVRALMSLSRVIGPRKKDGQVMPFTREDHMDAVSLWKQWWEKEGQSLYGNTTSNPSPSDPHHRQ